MDYPPSRFKLPTDATWPGPPPYLFTDDIAVAVDVALVTRRPLLVAGPPGSGKSMLAPAMAGLLGCRFLKHTFTSRSRLEELTSDFDHLRRLHDAQARGEGQHELPPEWTYRDPGLLWWAFDPASARLRGAQESEVAAEKSNGRFREPRVPPGGDGQGDAVILLDEIDKAEPDLPNDLLEPLDRLSFGIPDRREPVCAPQDATFLVVITTNGERELPPAFLRRCVSLVLEHPKRQRLVEIGRHHYPEVKGDLLERVAASFVRLRKEAWKERRRLPSTSEYLDAVRAARDLPALQPGEKLWAQVERASFLKPTDWTDAAPDED